MAADMNDNNNRISQYSAHSPCGKLVGVDANFVELRCPQYKGSIDCPGRVSLNTVSDRMEGVIGYLWWTPHGRGTGQVAGLSGRKGAGLEQQSNEKMRKKRFYFNSIDEFTFICSLSVLIYFNVWCLTVWRFWYYLKSHPSLKEFYSKMMFFFKFL